VQYRVKHSFHVSMCDRFQTYAWRLLMSKHLCSICALILLWGIVHSDLLKVSCALYMYIVQCTCTWTVGLIFHENSPIKQINYNLDTYPETHVSITNSLPCQYALIGLLHCRKRIWSMREDPIMDCIIYKRTVNRGLVVVLHWG